MTEYITERVWRKSDDPAAMCKHCNLTRAQCNADVRAYYPEAEADNLGRCQRWSNRRRGMKTVKHKFGFYYFVRLHVAP